MANITTVKELAVKIAEMRKAQQIFSSYSQAQVDKICHAVATAAIQARISLAKLAVQETQMGILEDKILKNHVAAEFVYHKYQNLKTCGILETNEELGMQKVAAPVGLVGAILSVTSPTSVAIFEILLCLKTRNAIFVSPHPQAKVCTCAAIELCAEAAYQAGAPKGIIDCFSEPTLELSTNLMESVDFVLSTDGEDMVWAEGASGEPVKKASGGNCPVIIHKSADLRSAACAIVQSKTFDAGLSSASEQAIIVVGNEAAEQMKREFQKQGGYFLNPEECASIRTVISDSKAKIIGKKAGFIAQLAGICVPPETKILLAPVSDLSQAEPLARQKLCPVLAFCQAESDFQALDMAEQILQLGGEGDTAGLYIDLKAEKDLTLWRERMKASRLLVNCPMSQGGIGGIYNELPPMLVLGYGTRGDGRLCGNLEPRQLLKVKTVVFQRNKSLTLRLPHTVYHEPGCTRAALLELREHYHYQRVFVLTDHYLYHNGNAAPVLRQLEQMGILYAVYYDITPNLTIEQIEKGMAAIQQFQPDIILGMGGGTAVDAAKLMRYRYEHPEVTWEALQVCFLNGNTRVLKEIKKESKTKLVIIATAAGTGAEDTPFAVVTDEKTGIPYPIYHPELLSTATIIDAEQMRSLPKGLTREGGMSTLVCGMESYLSLAATDYTDGFALIACKNVLNYLPQACDGSDGDEVVRQKLADASALAGIAAANTFPGLVYGMACALSAWHHLPHGVACGILLPEVMVYQVRSKGERRNGFFQHLYPSPRERYEALAAFCGVGGTELAGSFSQLLHEVCQLRDKAEIYPTIQAYGVEEAYFLDTLDRMTEVAWNSQWIIHSPVFPQMQEIRELYLRCYYGTDEKKQKKE